MANADQGGFTGAPDKPTRRQFANLIFHFQTIRFTWQCSAGHNECFVRDDAALVQRSLVSHQHDWHRNAAAAAAAADSYVSFGSVTITT